MDGLLTVGDVARRLCLSGEWVRRLGEQGKLTVLRTERGYRLFLRSEVERLAEERAKAHSDAGGAS